MSIPGISDGMLVQTVFIVDDDSAICDALRDLFESVGVDSQHYSSAEDFFSRWSSEAAGCVLLDVRLPGMSGMEMQEKLAGSGFAIPVIIMTAHGDIPMVRKAMKAGVVEFLIKPFPHEELLLAVKQAFAIDLMQRQASSLKHSIEARVTTLTVRERQVMELVTAGFRNREIADELDLSVATVKLYRGQVMDKLQAKSLADLVRMSERIKAS